MTSVEDEDALTEQEYEALHADDPEPAREPAREPTHPEVIPDGAET